MHLARALGQLGQCQLAMRPHQVRQPAPLQVLQRRAVLWRAPAAHASINPLSKRHPALTQSTTALPLLQPHDCIAPSSGCQSWRKQGACSGGAEASSTVAGACRRRRQRSLSRPCNINPAIGESASIIPAAISISGLCNSYHYELLPITHEIEHALECLRRTRESPEFGAGAGPAPAWFSRMTRL